MRQRVDRALEDSQSRSDEHNARADARAADRRTPNTSAATNTRTNADRNCYSRTEQKILRTLLAGNSWAGPDLRNANARRRLPVVLFRRPWKQTNAGAKANHVNEPGAAATDCDADSTDSDTDPSHADTEADLHA